MRIFGYLLFNDRLLTHANMVLRNMNCDPRCVMCDNCPLEMTVHLMFECRFAKEVWLSLGQMASITIPVVATLGMEIGDLWEVFISRVRRYGCKTRELMLCACWHIWKARNSKIFKDENVIPRIVSGRIWGKFLMWCKHC